MIVPDCLRSSSPSRLASTARSMSSSGPTSRMAAQGVSNSMRPRRPTANPNSNAYVVAAQVGCTHCLVFRPRPCKWPDCVHEDEALRTTLSSVASLSRSPTASERASFMVWRANSWPNGVRMTAVAIALSRGSRARASNNPKSGRLVSCRPQRSLSYPEQNQVGIETVELSQPLEREFSSRRCPLAQAIVLHDRICVVLSGRLAGSCIQET